MVTQASPTRRGTCCETIGNSNGTMPYPVGDTRDKGTNIPGRNVGLAAPSSVPHQLYHVNFDKDHKNFNDNPNHEITYEPEYNSTPETKSADHAGQKHPNHPDTVAPNENALYEGPDEGPG